MPWGIVKGCFTQCDCDCDFFITTNGLYVIQCKCSHGVIATMKLKPIQLINKSHCVNSALNGSSRKNKRFFKPPSSLIKTLAIFTQR